MTTYNPSSGYLRDILAQPAALEHTLAQLEHTDLPLEWIGLKGLVNEPPFTILTGMGSSYHALYPLYYRLARASFPTAMIETGELIHFGTGLLSRAQLVVIVSQSGRSAEVVRLLERLAKDRDRALQDGLCDPDLPPVDVVGVTNTPGSPLAQASTPILTAAGEESAVSSKTYLATLLALDWLGDRLVGQSPAGRLARAKGLAAAVASYVERWREHTTRLEALLAGIEHVFLVGRGTSLAACGQGALTTKEVAHVHAEAMSSAALRHGPIEMLDESCFVLVFAGRGPSRQLNRRLYDELAGKRIPSAWVDTGSSGSPFDLPQANERLRPILEILPVEMMTLALASLRGRTAESFEQITKITTTE